MRAVETMPWHYCDEFRAHKLSGRHALEATERDLFDRCASFLRELEYKWAVDDFIVTGRDFENPLARVGMTIDDPYWPFRTRSALSDYSSQPQTNKQMGTNRQ